MNKIKVTGGRRRLEKGSKIKKSLLLTIVITILFIDIAPLLGRINAVDLETQDKLEQELTPKTEGIETEDIETEDIETEDIETDTDVDVEELSGEDTYEGNLSKQDNQETDISVEGLEKYPEVKIEEGKDVQPKGESKSFGIQRSMLMQSQTTNNYVVAKDSDFIWKADSVGGYHTSRGNGRYQYRGTDKYVEVPSQIEGVTINNYRDMFRGSTGVNAVKTTKKVWDMSYMFQDMDTDRLDLRDLNTSSVSSTRGMFLGNKAKHLDLRGFNTSNVGSMYLMFNKSQAEEILGIEGFDTGNVSLINGMFSESHVKNLDLRNFNTSKVNSLENMFSHSRASYIDIRTWDTKNVTTMTDMFYGARATDIRGIENLNTSKVTNMERMFRDTRIPEINVSNFDTRNVTNMNEMFRGTQAKSVKGLSEMETINVTSMVGMFWGASIENINLESFYTSRITSMKQMFDGTKAQTYNLSSFDTSYVTDMSYMFRNTQAPVIDISSFDLSSVNNTDYMFEGSTTNKVIVKSETEANIVNNSKGKPSTVEVVPKYKLATDADFIGTTNGSFKYIGKEEYIEVPHKIRGINVTSYRGMFENTSVKGVVSTNKQVNDMSNMFKGNTSTLLDVSFIDTTSVDDMSGMFEGTKTQELDLRNFITTNVTNMRGMFRNTEVKDLDLGNFNMDKVKDTTNMLQDTKATSGYARTTRELSKLNNNTSKPTTLKFTIWSAVSEQIGNKWSNDKVDIKITAISDTVGVDFVEMVNQEGRNLVLNSNTPRSSTAYHIHTYYLSEDWAVGETWTITIKGTVNSGNRFGIWSNGSMSSQGRLTPIGNNIHKLTVEVRPSIMTGIASGQGVLNVFNAPSTGAKNANIEWIKVERGDKSTPWTPAPEDTESGGEQSDVYSVYNNGTYIFRATDNSGNVRTIAHTVDTIDRVKPTAEVTPSTTGKTPHDVTLYVNAKDDLSGVKTITLPDGTKVNGNEAEYVAKDNKSYTFKITDNAGNTETVSYTVSNIDRSLVVVTATVDNKNWTNKPINIKVTSEDSASKLENIEMNNSPMEGRNLVLDSGKPKKTTTEYLIGNYTMSRPWKEGQEYVSTVHGDVNEGQVMGIWFNGASSHQADSVKIGDRLHQAVFRGKAHKSADGKIYGDDNINNEVFRVYNRRQAGARFGEIDRVKLEMGTKATPWTPAPEDIKLINNSKTYPVIANGLYSFLSNYANGVTSEVSVNVSNIDIDAPTIEVLNNPEDWAEEDEIELEINVTDNNQSGVKVTTLPNGETTTDTNIKYAITENGNYDFIVEDNVGNKETHTITVDKMMIPYFFYIFDSKGEPLTGAEFELLRDGDVHATATSDVNGLVDFGKVPPTGKYTIRQTKAPDGYIVDPEEKDVDVEDETDPIEIINYPRGTVMPSTGTSEITVIVSMVFGLIVIVFIVNKKKKGYKK